MRTGLLGGRVGHGHRREREKIHQETSRLLSLHSCLSPELPALSPRTLRKIINSTCPRYWASTHLLRHPNEADKTKLVRARNGGSGR